MEKMYSKQDLVKMAIGNCKKTIDISIKLKGCCDLIAFQNCALIEINALYYLGVINDKEYESIRESMLDYLSKQSNLVTG